MKKLRIAAALIMTLSFAVSLFAVFPGVKGQITAVPDRETGAYLSVNPPVIGIHQELLVNLWVYPSPTGPHYEMGSTYPMYFHNISITFTRPDGSKDTFMPEEGTKTLKLAPGQTEEVGAIWFMYQPTQLGTWSVQFTYPGESYIALNYSVYYKPSTSRVVTFTVQEDNVQIGLPPVQLPTGYWERPINADNREWAQISGSYLYAGTYGNYPENVNLYTEGPESSHILWKREVSLGGLVGGEWAGTSYGAGGDAERIGPLYVWNGRVYENIATMNGTEMICINLRTGEVVWQQIGSISAMVLGTAGGLYEFYGSPTAYIWSYTTTQWKKYDAYTGRLTTTITRDFTGGTPVWLDENVCYLVRQGTWSPTSLRRPYNQLIKWNNSRPGNWTAKIEWTVNLKQPDGTGPGEGSRGSSVQLLRKLGIATVWSTGEGHEYAYDLITGQQLWIYDVGYPAMRHLWDQDENTYKTKEADSTVHKYSYSRTGMTELWSTEVGLYPWGCNFVNKAFAYGNMYMGTYDGRIYCIDQATGEIEWEYYIGDTTETPYGTWALAFYRGAVADGKVYFGSNEHTPTQPRTRGNKLVCIDAYTGEEIWKISSFAPSYAGAISVAEGYLTCGNENDGILYCFGKGKTETAVTASPKDSVLGNKVVIEGSVLDLSLASAKTAAISDEDMTEWMEYLHMQHPIPAEAKGVDISLDAVDPNNNFVHIGTATSTMSGTYGFAFTPEVPGLYRIIATFAGSESYWSSYAETYVNVEEAAAVTPPAEQVPTDLTPVYMGMTVVGIAIIIAIAVAVLLLRKR